MIPPPQSAARSRPRAAGRTSPTRPRGRRRLRWVLVGLLFAGGLTLLLWGSFHKAVKEIQLPLRHEDIIRQQARDKGLDPALIAAVIYAESRFVAGRTSSAGAEGLMQITPATAQGIAKRSGGTAFVLEDLATPQVNISYGSYLLAEHVERYEGNLVAALAAYNAGPRKADEWGGTSLRAEGIPYPETRAYVEKVLDARERYGERYPRELGL